MEQKKEDVFYTKKAIIDKLKNDCKPQLGPDDKGNTVPGTVWLRAIYEGEKQITDLKGYLEKLRQRKEELQSQINEETTIVRGMTMTSAEKRVRDNQIYFRECKYKNKK